MVACGQAPTPTEEPGPVIDFTVKDLSGQSVSLSDLRGKVVLVNFWATWCPPCKEEMPLLQEYYLAHREDNFVLVGVNVSGRPEEVAAYVEEAGYVFPIWLDPPGNVLIDMGAQGLPISLLVDSGGHLRKRWIGPLTREVLEAEITPLLLTSAD
jgi:thiol-disulfide isomerase/thioredoxin